MSRRAVLAVGIPLVGAGGYYLYSAGGDTKVAQKKAEHDAASAKRSLKGETLSSEEAKKQGEEFAARAGKAIDGTVNDIRREVHDADKIIAQKAGEVEAKFDKLKQDGAAQFEKTKKETGKEMHDTIDKFDKTVERKTAEAKSGISSWFGFGK